MCPFDGFRWGTDKCISFQSSVKTPESLMGRGTDVLWDGLKVGRAARCGGTVSSKGVSSPNPGGVQFRLSGVQTTQQLDKGCPDHPSMLFSTPRRSSLETCLPERRGWGWGTGRPDGLSESRSAVRPQSSELPFDILCLAFAWFLCFRLSEWWPLKRRQGGLLGAVCPKKTTAPHQLPLADQRGHTEGSWWKLPGLVRPLLSGGPE